IFAYLQAFLGLAVEIMTITLKITCQDEIYRILLEKPLSHGDYPVVRAAVDAAPFCSSKSFSPVIRCTNKEGRLEVLSAQTFAAFLLTASSSPASKSQVLRLAVELVERGGPPQSSWAPDPRDLEALLEGLEDDAPAITAGRAPAKRPKKLRTKRRPKHSRATQVSPLLEELPPEETQEIDCGVSNDDEEGAPEIAWSATPESTPPQSPRLSCGQQQIVWMPMWLPVYPLQVY
ncbi:unnamed protein product, partial [Polarella glacialis]